MYNNICLTMADQLPRAGISRIIPVGMAVQKARGKMGDVLCRDGFHLNKAYGRYTAACTWCEFLTGRKVVGNAYHPKSVDAQTALICQKMAHQAMRDIKR